MFRFRMCCFCALQSVIIRCVGSVDAESLREIGGRPTSPLSQVIQYIEATLGYQYHSSWSLALQVLASNFEVLGDACRDQLAKVGRLS